MNIASITERLANLSITTVLITVAVLVGLRFLLMRQRTPIAKSMAEIAESLAVAMALVFLLIRPFIVQAFFIPSASMRPTLIESDHILVNKFIYRFSEPKRGDVMVFRSPPEANPDGQERDFIKRVVAVPGDLVRITAGHVRIGNQEYSHMELRELLLGSPRAQGRIKLSDNKVYQDGKPLLSDEIADKAGYPNAKVRVFPGVVYINGKALKEHYTAEDPGMVYPNSNTPGKWIVLDKQGRQEVKIPKDKLLMMGDNRNDSNDSRMWGLLDRERALGKAMFIFWPLNRIRWVH